MTARPCNILLVYPRFGGWTFWNFAAACNLFGVRYPTPPLGLITLAALLPSTWSVRLVDRNTEDLADADLDWADLVMTGGMLPQHADLITVIDLCRARGKPVAIGGPSVTSTPELYRKANFRILGEAEGILESFIAAWEAGDRQGTFEAEKFTADVTKSPIPRFDLLKFENYLYIGVQFSRGCPFTCEFCDIIELYGRSPRTKTNAQMLAELEELYRLGYRGHVDFVDDNLIGNKKAVKLFLPELITWLEQHGYPFEFTTEASINLADDAKLLTMMNQANFVGVFVGIESPDPETLVKMRKKQNTRRNLAESIHKLYASGLYVTAGFIVGFDTERASMADAMIELIEEAAIPVCMVGLLYALPNTQLTRRLAKEGRLHTFDEAGNNSGGADQCTYGLNFDTLRPKRDVLLDYKRVLDAVYEPTAYLGRLRRLATLLDNSQRPKGSDGSPAKDRFKNTEILRQLIAMVPDNREAFWQVIAECAAKNPKSTRYIILLMAFYLHLGPFSRDVSQKIEQRIERLDDEPVAARQSVEPSLTL